jgi:hypothetical protein
MLLPFFLCLSLSAAASAEDRVDRYRAECKALIDRVAVSGRGLDKEDVLRRADRLAQMGVGIARHHQEMNPECADILDVFIADLPQMKASSPEEMERLYHNAEILSEKGLDIAPYDYAVEDCMEITHLITHPAAVPVHLRAFEADEDTRHIRKIKEELVRLHQHLGAHHHE